MPRRCVALFSGGLDSTLALALMVREGLEVVACHGTHVFSPKTDTEEGRAALRERALRLGAVEIRFFDVTPDMIALTKNPRYGYGSHLNACLDCRMLTIAHGRQVLADTDASFLVSGEVVGQPPMSQRRDAMATVDKHVRELGLEGLLLRPLSAQRLAQTTPEREGWVDRTRLYGFSGRNRKPQMALARELGITDYPTPAGGCLLTDPGFAVRLGDLMEHMPEWGANDVRLLRVGRHIRLTPQTKLIASRRDVENAELERLAGAADLLYITMPRPGAIVMLRGAHTPEAGRAAAGLAVYYSKHRAAGTATVLRWQAGNEAARQELGSVPVLDPAMLGDRTLGNPSA